eukprot:GHVN01011100.1.p1 GENE.GHVN01011100.1~~GHVN01011100.1.p1  ORF type:complete len:201 (-),score=25.93 GHVN01011100.1:349-951(-)
MSIERGSVLCGVTGSGKSSIIELLKGKDPTDPCLTSDTSVTSKIKIKTLGVSLFDTPGFLDNRQANDRKILFTDCLGFIKNSGVKVTSLFLCMTYNERLNEEAILWYSDAVAAFRAPPERVFVVLTKADSAFARKIAEKMKNEIRDKLPGCKVLMCGVDYTQEVVNAMQASKKWEPLDLEGAFYSSEELLTLLRNEEKGV